MPATSIENNRVSLAQQFPSWILRLPPGNRALRCAMRLSLKHLIASSRRFFLVAADAQSSPALHEKRQHPTDLEVSGALAGLPADSTRYITHDDLMAMPLVTFTSSGDTNFVSPTRIRGVKLGGFGARAGSVSRAGHGGGDLR